MQDVFPHLNLLANSKINKNYYIKATVLTELMQLEEHEQISMYIIRQSTQFSYVQLLSEYHPEISLIACFMASFWE